MFERWRIVVDTNVVVAALLHPGRAPHRSIEGILTGLGRVIVDARIEDEYRDVLGRRKFRSIALDARERLLDRLLDDAEQVETVLYRGALIDDDDRAFVEVCLGGFADILLTGNARHFPTTLGFSVLAPSALLATFDAAPTRLAP
jgi:predicted nucleic acid-binding protein